MNFRKAFASMALGAALVGSATFAHAYPSVWNSDAASVLGSRYHISTGRVLDDAARYHVSVFQLEPAYAISHEARVPLNRVWTLHEQGMTWKEVAARVGVGPGGMANLEARFALNPNQWWADSLAQRYDVSPARVRNLWRYDGWPGALAALETGYRYHVSPMVVIDRWRPSQNWDQVYTYFYHDNWRPALRPGYQTWTVWQRDPRWDRVDTYDRSAWHHDYDWDHDGD